MFSKYFLLAAGGFLFLGCISIPSSDFKTWETDGYRIQVPSDWQQTYASNGAAILYPPNRQNGSIQIMIDRYTASNETDPSGPIDLTQGQLVSAYKSYNGLTFDSKSKFKILLEKNETINGQPLDWIKTQSTAAGVNIIKFHLIFFKKPNIIIVTAETPEIELQNNTALFEKIFETFQIKN